MIASVARDSGRSMVSVAGDSYALTLFAHLHKQDADHLDSLVAERYRLEAAELGALAFHAPEKIAGERLRWKAKIGGLESRASVYERAVELMNRAAKQRGEPLPS